MYAYPVEELAWAIAREREEEARQTRPHTQERPRPVEPLRSWVARWLAGPGADAQRSGGEVSLGTANTACC